MKTKLSLQAMGANNPRLPPPPQALHTGQPETHEAPRPIRLCADVKSGAGFLSALIFMTPIDGAEKHPCTGQGPGAPWEQEGVPGNGALQCLGFTPQNAKTGKKHDAECLFSAWVPPSATAARRQEGALIEYLLFTCKSSGRFRNLQEGGLSECLLCAGMSLGGPGSMLPV